MGISIECRSRAKRTIIVILIIQGWKEIKREWSQKSNSLAKKLNRLNK